MDNKPNCEVAIKMYGNASRGSCCCNCKHSTKVMKHPFNASFAKGKISEQLGWACTIQYEDKSNEGMIIFSDHEHSLCEMWIQKEKPKDAN